MRALLLAIPLCWATLCWCPPSARAAPSDADAAAAAFAHGQKLYSSGDYRAAIAAFELAHSKVKHYSNLFNIARCYENLGETAKAIAFYERARTGAPPTAQGDIDSRLARLRKTPTKLFVASQPAGAQVTVDGRGAPEAGTTPLMVMLRPGEHVLLLRQRDHLLEAARVVLKAGVARTVNVKLRRRPKVVACSKATPCPRPPAPLVDAHALRLHFQVGPIIGVTKGRPLAPGLGARIYASIRRLLFGAHVGLFPVGEEQVDVKLGDDYNRARFNSIMTQVDLGYTFPFENAKIEAILGIGINYDRVTFTSDVQPIPPETVREAFAFAWALGGNVEAMFTRWFSVALSVRGGAIHGDRVNKSTQNPTATNVSGSFPYLFVLGAVGFHL